GMVTVFGSAAPVAGFVPEMTMEPSQVVPAAIDPGATVIGKVALVPTTAAVTPVESHAVPQAADAVMLAVAVKLACTPVLLSTRTFCVLVWVWPIWIGKFSGQVVFA